MQQQTCHSDVFMLRGNVEDVVGDKARRASVTPKMTHTPLFKCLRLNASMASVSGEHPRMTETARGRLSHLILARPL